MKKLPGFLVFLLVFAGFAAAQQNSFSPAVSQIKAEARNNLIRLTWTDSTEAHGPVYIFRSVRPFTGAIPANIRPIAVRYGQQYFIDDTEDMTNLYYFVAASDTNGHRYDVVIPNINSTYVNIALGQIDIIAPAVIEPLPSSGNLNARQDGEHIVITYETVDPLKSAILYRSSQPVRQPQDLRNASVVLSGVTFPFADFPVPGFLWYYAVVYEDEISSGNMGIIPGVNATVSPVLISAADIAQRSMRPMPLPMLTLRDSPFDGFFLTDIPRQAFWDNHLSADRNAQRLQKPPLQLKTPRVFFVDLEAPTSGEESALVQIVHEFIEKHDWENASVSLQHYLSLPRSKDVEIRARFYLGQSFYYTGKYREALFEFLTFKSFYPDEANVWIETVLAAMVY